MGVPISILSIPGNRVKVGSDSHAAESCISSQTRLSYIPGKNVSVNTAAIKQLQYLGERNKNMRLQPDFIKIFDFRTIVIFYSAFQFLTHLLDSTLKYVTYG